MSIEPGIRDAVERVMTDWTAYRKCPVCTARTGFPCWVMNGAVAGGRPDGVPKTLPIAHGARQRRKRR